MSPHPPLVPCREATPEELNRSASTLLKEAEALGWRARATFASGVIGDDKHKRQVDSVVVRLRRYPVAAVGSWWNRKFETGYVWSVVSPPVPVGARDLAAFVKGVA